MMKLVDTFPICEMAYDDKSCHCKSGLHGGLPETLTWSRWALHGCRDVFDELRPHLRHLGAGRLVLNELDSGQGVGAKRVQINGH